MGAAKTAFGVWCWGQCPRTGGWDFKRDLKWGLQKGLNLLELTRKEFEPALHSPWTLQGPLPIPRPPAWVSCVYTDSSFLQRLCPQRPHQGHHHPHICSFTAQAGHMLVNMPPPPWLNVNAIRCTQGTWHAVSSRGMRARAKGWQVWPQIHCHLEHGDSVRGGYPFQVAALTPALPAILFLSTFHQK